MSAKPTKKRKVKASKGAGAGAAGTKPSAAMRLLQLRPADVIASCSDDEAVLARLLSHTEAIKFAINNAQVALKTKGVSEGSESKCDDCEASPLVMISCASCDGECCKQCAEDSGEFKVGQCCEEGCIEMLCSWCATACDGGGAGGCGELVCSSHLVEEVEGWGSVGDGLCRDCAMRFEDAY